MAQWQDGLLIDGKVTYKASPLLVHGPLKTVDAIVVHQTDSDSAASTLASYGVKGTGAHFLIDKDGTIYQTVPINKKAWHVGKIRSKCYETHSCEPDEKKFYTDLTKASKGHFNRFVVGTNKHENAKPYPNRFPNNEDSIGIELVGKSLDASGSTYEALTSDQQKSLDWLIAQVLDALKLKRSDIYRHPEVSRKGAGEAASAQF